jgi:hypothetical protein
LQRIGYIVTTAAAAAASSFSFFNLNRSIFSDIYEKTKYENRLPYN